VATARLDKEQGCVLLMDSVASCGMYLRPCAHPYRAADKLFGVHNAHVLRHGWHAMSERVMVEGSC
jgi:hypothetical protein